MTKPNIQIDDLVREMTDEEYEVLLASGWTPSEETATDQAPASDDAGAPSAGVVADEGDTAA